MALIQCPECGGQVSDRAFSCPHCGFPINQSSHNVSVGRPVSRKKSSGNMRLPNGFGTVQYLKGRRRKPFVAKVKPLLITNDQTRKTHYKYQYLGSFETRQEAVTAILKYNENPRALRKSKTLQQLYDEWLPKYSEGLSSQSSLRTVTSAWAYVWPLYQAKVTDLSPGDLKDCIINAALPNDPSYKKRAGAKASPRTQQRMKSLFNLLWDYAEEYGIVEKNYARLFTLDNAIEQDVQAQQREGKPFTYQEVLTLWTHLGKLSFVDMIICQIYTGMRPQELCLLRLENVHISEGWMMGGMKTESGFNRLIPIHPEILGLIQNSYEYASSINSSYLFNDPVARDHPNITYDMYRHRFRRVMDSLKMDHVPHDCRHTFITYAKKSGMDPYDLKRIVGHKIYDVTEKVYTHTSLEDLKIAIHMFKISEQES